MLVSVIIPTYNSVRVLKKTLPAILQQKTEGRFKFEIILINDGSTDDTASWLSSQQEPNLRVMTLATNQGRSVARNAGFRASKGDVIVFMDGDVIACPEANN